MSNKEIENKYDESEKECSYCSGCKGHFDAEDCRWYLLNKIKKMEEFMEKHGIEYDSDDESNENDEE